MSPQQTISHYRIMSKLGQGGMGEVWRATDTRLGREVAIKTLPELFANDPERMARFQREAQVLASLNHPNIAHIYDIEQHALVMELIQGEPLKGPLPMDRALAYAKQIAEALEAAHEKGIVHRDLKPANVMITPTGVVKVLDFGLARVTEASAATDPSLSPTITGTRGYTGVIMGTAAYMAPEQARGQAVDKRADIWAFGCVLYEMLTGKPAFAGETTSDILAAVMKEEPDLSKLPPRIRSVVERCLKKDPHQRWGSIADVRWLLDTLPETQVRPAPSRIARYLPWAAAAVFAVTAIAAWLWKPSPSQPLLEMEINAPEGIKLGDPSWGQFELSPDGHRLAFIAEGADGKSRIWLRPLERENAVPLAGTEGATKFPFWSPDSRWLAFFANRKLQKIDVTTGGPPQPICDCGEAAEYATWSFDGTILFNIYDQPIQRVPADGGNPAPVFGFDSGRGETQQIAPYVLPDGKHFVYLSFGKETVVVLASLDGKRRRVLFPGETTVSYVANPAGGGWLLYNLQEQLFARPFDPRKGEFTGEAALVANSVPTGPSWSSSANGILAFRHKHESESELVWVDRRGVRSGALAGPAQFGQPRISPDGAKIAFARFDQPNTGIWLFDTVRQIATRLTSEAQPAYSPTWSLDGKHLFYSSVRQNDHAIIERAVDGEGQDAVLLKTQALSMEPTDCFAGGRWLVTTETTAGIGIVWLISRRDGTKSIRFHGGHEGSVSPDGRWLLYADGQRPRGEVFVTSLPTETGGPAAPGEWKISAGDGDSPAWRGDGKEIFYLTSDGTIMAVPVESNEGSFRPGAPRALFRTPMKPGRFRDYDVTRDGKRFLLNVPIATSEEEPIRIVVNWPKLINP